jgi:outer membrane protein TolC
LLRISDLSAAYARRQQTLARLGISQADLFPQGSTIAEASKEKSTQTGLAGSMLPEYFDQYHIGSSLSYELDLWGRVRDLVNAEKANADAADYAISDVQVTLQTQLARQYFALRFLDAEMATLKNAVKTRQENVRMRWRT